MEDYKAETSEILSRYLAHEISISDCVAMLNMALAGLIPSLRGDQILELRAIMVANTNTMMEELEKQLPCSSMRMAS